MTTETQCFLAQLRSTYKHLIFVTAYARPARVQARQSPSTEKDCGHQVASLDEELLATDSF